MFNSVWLSMCWLSSPPPWGGSLQFESQKAPRIRWGAVQRPGVGSLRSAQHLQHGDRRKQIRRTPARPGLHPRAAGASSFLGFLSHMLPCSGVTYSFYFLCMNQHAGRSLPFNCPRSPSRSLAAQYPSTPRNIDHFRRALLRVRGNNNAPRFRRVFPAKPPETTFPTRLVEFMSAKP